MNLDLIKGICPIVAAPFARDESVDYDSLRNLVKTLAEGGCHALTLFGIAGEYSKLDEAEQREMMRVTVDEAHRHNVPVIVSNTRHSTANAVAFAKEIERAGADCMMVLPPFFLKPGADLICPHAAAVAKAVPNLPVMMQYAPEQTGVAIAPGVFARLTDEAPNVVYYKIECKPAGKYISNLIGMLGDKIRVFAGNAGYQMLETFDRGAVGAMPGCSMYDLYLDIYDKYFAGDRKGAIEAHNFILPILNHIRQNVEEIICFEKKILMKRGIITTDVCRAPGFSTDEEFERLFEEYYALTSPRFRSQPPQPHQPS